MAIAKENKSDQSEGKLWNLCRMPFWQHNTSTAAASGGVGTISGGPSAGGSAAGSGASSSSSLVHHPVGGGSHHYSHITNHLNNLEGPTTKRQVTSSSSITTVARSLLPASARRKLRLDPSTKMYFPCKLFYEVFFTLISLLLLSRWGISVSFLEFRLIWIFRKYFMI